MARFIYVLALTLASCVFYDTGRVELADVRPSADTGVGDGDSGEVDAGACAPESDERFCDRLVANCDAVTAPDNCGESRTVDCGTCTEPATCGGGGTSNVCACSDQSDEEFCMLVAECGPATALDVCGQMRTVDCGTCTAPETCGGGGMAGFCGCAEETDVVFCGRQEACGLLTADDNCGLARSADCGTCPDGETCVDNSCVCEPEDNTSFCTRLRGCGELTAVDNCNMSRTVDCGTCTGGEACENNQCACSAEDDATFCSRLGYVCGELTETDNCQVMRTVPKCGDCSMGETCNAGVCDSAFPPAGIDVWLRSDSGVTASMQGELTDWADHLTGEVWSVTMIVARPTIVSGQQGGFDAIRFFGGQRIERTIGSISAGELTVVAMFSREDNTDREGPLLGEVNSLNNELTFGTTATTMRFESTTAGLSYSASVLPTTTPTVFSFRATGTDFEFFQNDQLTATTPLVPSGNFEFDQIGGAMTQRMLRGDLYELMVWPRSLSDSEHAAVVSYLTSRYGL